MVSLKPLKHFKHTHEIVNDLYDYMNSCSTI